MRTKNPMRGLLTFLFYSASRNMSIVLVICILLAAAFLIFGSAGWFSLFIFIFVLNFPIVLIMSMASREGLWERFQLTMPVSRSDLIRMQYLGVVFPVIFAACVVVVVIGIATVTNDDMFNDGFVNALVESAYYFGLPLLMAGTSFPLASSKLGKDKGEAILTISMLASGGMMMVAPQIGHWLGFDLSMAMVSVSILAVSIVVFVGSYFITKAMYAKSDF